MSQVCSKCSRANPPEAAYCYHDGAILAGHSANGGPINQGSAPFPTQFVFPSGHVCHNFDQLAIACQQDWKSAVDLLKQGFLAGFLGGLGRADLALAAQEAVRFPDQDRGLDQLLAKLPSQVLENPQLKAEPSVINLGQVPMGADRQIELHLANLGMRLLYGSVVSDCKWLTLGETPGNAEKLFQFGAETIIPVHIRGQHLRAGTKPLEGKLVIESNGGNATVRVRAEVPVKPFKDGVLMGAASPRQVAEKALAQPKVAAPLFESGAVAEWFTLNGWTYPVQGPSASGLGAVQQFFEALGLAKAPKIEVSPQTIALHGQAGKSVHATIEVKSVEKRPVYAYATSDQSWIEVKRAKLNGRIATISVRVPSVPDRPGETLHAKVHVTGNGNQRFVLPLTLGVESSSPFADLTLPGIPPAGAAEPIVPVVPAYAITGAAAQEIGAVATGAPLQGDVNAGTPAGVVLVGGILATAGAAGRVAPAPAAAAVPAAARRRERTPVWAHLLPLAVLALGLLGIMIRDVAVGPKSSGGLEARLGLHFDYSSNKNSSNKKDKTRPKLTNSFSFGLVEFDDPHNQKEFKRLTRDEYGRNNSTVVKIDGIDRVFSRPTEGDWDDKPATIDRGMTGSWLFFEKILVTQTVKLIPGEPVEVSPGIYKQMLDTCLVRYQIENRSQRPRRVGLRLLLDTFIGKNDAPTFTVPDVHNLVDKQMDFKPAQHVPDFVEALERPNIQNPGTVAHFAFRLGDKLEVPDRVSLTHYPGKTFTKFYDVPVKDIGDDSAVAVYWKEILMAPGGAPRNLGFSIGLGNVSTGLTIGGNFAPGGELTVISLISDYEKGQTVTLAVPEGFTLAEGSKATQPVPAPAKHDDGSYRPSPVTWRIRSSTAGTFTFEVKSSTNKTQTRKIIIKQSSVF